MGTQKLYAGAKLREMRTRLTLTQREFASKLGVSLPYLNQMENNNRPISTTVVLALAQEFGMDVTELSTGDSERLVSDMREALADPVFADALPPLADLRLTASNAPALARAFIELHRTYRQTHERLASLDEALGREDARIQASPWEEVRDFFHYCDNYIDAMDRAAELFANRADGPGGIRQAALNSLSERGIQVIFSDIGSLRSYDTESRILRLSSRAEPQTQVFQLLLQVALISQDKLLEATLDFAKLLCRGVPDALRRLSGRSPRRPSRSGIAQQSVRRFNRTSGPSPVHLAKTGRQRHSVLLRSGRSGGNHHQTTLGHASAICTFWRGLPIVERTSRFRNTRSLPAATCGNPGRGALYLPGTRRVKIGWVFRCACAPICHRLGMRSTARPGVGLCRQPRYQQSQRL